MTFWYDRYAIIVNFQIVYLPVRSKSFDSIAKSFVYCNVINFNPLKVGKVNTDDNQEIAARYGIMSIPTLMIFRGGEVVSRIVGAQPKQQLTGKIDSILAG